MTARSFTRPTPVNATTGEWAADAPTVERAQNPRKLRILSVEDLKDNQEIITLILSGAGHRVDCAGNGGEAITLHGMNAYDLILMDMQMPVMDGIEAARRIRHSDHPRHDIPILAMTGNTQPDRIEQLRSAGITDVIGKPFRKADLLQKVALWTAPKALNTTSPLSCSDMIPPDFIEGDFDELVALMGPDTVLQWIDALYVKLLPSLLGTENDLMKQPAVVHDIVAKAGMLGFRTLSESCARLDQQILGKLGLAEFPSTRRHAGWVSGALPRLRELMNALR